MAVLVALQLLTNTSRRASDMHAVYQRRISPVKPMLDTEDNLMNFMLPLSLVNLTQDRKTRSRDEIRDKKWWEDGLQNWSETLRKYRDQSLSWGNFVKKPSTFRLDINLETDNPSKTNYPSVSTSLDESASDEFCSIIRLRTGFILETDCPSQTDNPSRRIIRL